MTQSCHSLSLSSLNCFALICDFSTQLPPLIGFIWSSHVPPTTICLLWLFSKATLLQQRAQQSVEQINKCYPKAKWRVPWVILFLASRAHNISSIDLHCWKTSPSPEPTDADYYSRWLDVTSAWLLGLIRLNYAEAAQSDIFKPHSRWKQIVFRVTSQAFYISSFHCCRPLTCRVTGRSAVLSFVVENDQ